MSGSSTPAPPKILPLDPTTKVGVPTGTAGARRVGEVGHPVWQVLDIASVVESSPGSSLWRADGGPFTGDGTHHGGRATNAIRAYVAAWAAGLTLP